MRTWLKPAPPSSVALPLNVGEEGSGMLVAGFSINVSGAILSVFSSATLNRRVWYFLAPEAVWS